MRSEDCLLPPHTRLLNAYGSKRTTITSIALLADCLSDLLATTALVGGAYFWIVVLSFLPPFSHVSKFLPFPSGLLAYTHCSNVNETDGGHFPQ